MKAAQVLILLLITGIFFSCNSKPDGGMLIKPRLFKQWHITGYLKGISLITDDGKKRIDELLKTELYDCFECNNRSNEKKDICTCKELFDYGDEYYSMTGGSDQNRRFSSMKMDCEALRVLFSVKPSKISFIKDVKLDEYIVDLLPGSLCCGNKNMECAATLRQEDKIVASNVDNNFLEFKGYIFSHLLTPVAYGDFNEDGYEDMMFLYSISAIEGHGDYTDKLVICTKLETNGDLKILSVF
ncbi:MAG: hypothetical protein CVV21_08255 [Candidatus Goldiibacteriota bacterium HGW-Goldbacteria-1]|jgi:hypothetical protein|nr:MAG: hypothetical protein CVV21_08255 [Candidatus Goldiibacteriota bacterium HGW-Goldbacteria-1]